ncbi:MAG: hypothetical protein ACTSRV_15990 [Candidatus Freyarchaeota archaeon]
MLRGKRILVVVIGIFLIGLGFGQVGCAGGYPSHFGWVHFLPTVGGYAPAGKADTPISSKEAVTFTYVPLEDDSYDYIIPLGNVGPPGHTFPSDHIYFVLKDGSYPVVAPASGVITEIVNWTQSDWSYQDYELHIKHTDTFETYFYHMSGIADWILSITGEIESESQITVNIPVAAGQEVGRAEKQPGGSVCLDWGAINYEITLNFIHPETYGEGVNVHTVCPLDYLNESLKQQAYAKVWRTGDPPGGKIDYDLPGRLSGNWFIEGSPPGIWDGSTQLAFVYYVHNASQMIVSVGGNALAPLPIGVFNATGPDFGSVSADNGTVTYHLVGEYPDNIKGQIYTLIVQVVGEERIRVEAFEGYQEGKSFTDKAVYYNRIGPYGPDGPDGPDGPGEDYGETFILDLAILNQLTSYSQQRSLIVFGVAGGVIAVLAAALTLVMFRGRH